MGFEAAFNVVPSGKESIMEVNANAFTIGGQLEQRASDKIDWTKSRIADMQKIMKKDLDADEMKVAWLAIEREMEQIRCPQTIEQIKKDKNISTAEAVNEALYGITLSLNDFIANRLQKVIETVDNESWTGTVSRSEAGEILKKLERDRGVKDEQKLGIEAAAFMQNYIPIGRSTRRQADEAYAAK